MDSIVANIENDIRIVADATEAVRRELYSPNKYENALIKQVEHGLFPARDVTLALSDLGTGAQIELAAGQVSKLTITGLTDWHFLAAALTLTNPSRLFAMPLTGTVEPPEQAAGQASYRTRTARIDPPQYVYRIITEATDYTGFTIDLASENGYSLPAQYFWGPYIRTIQTSEMVKGFSTYFIGPDQSRIRASAIIDNLPAGIAISTAQDQILHRIAQKLAYEQAAITPDIAAALNDADDEITLNIFSQTDGVVHISGQHKRIRQTIGYQPESPVQTVSPWQTLAIQPSVFAGNTPQTTTFSAKVQAKGAAHLGLLNRADTRQGIYPHPYMHLAQPFQPMAEARAVPITITGCWLLVEHPPEADAALTLAIHRWDAKNNVPGQLITKTTSNVSAALMDHSKGPDGMIGAWVKFSEPWVLDTPDQAALHCLVLSEVQTPLRLSEALLTHARLLPLMSQDIRRDKAWIKRDFGAAAKVLMFELGYETEQETKGILRISHRTGTVEIAVSARSESFVTTFQSGSITLSSDLPVELSDVSCTSQSAAPQIAGITP